MARVQEGTVDGALQYSTDVNLRDCLKFCLAYGVNDMCFWAENERKVRDVARKYIALIQDSPFPLHRHIAGFRRNH